jgi:hypothetical protein
MGKSIGIIFHDNWEDFSPLMYSHYGADSEIFFVQRFLREYYKENNINEHDRYKYDPCHMMVGFLQSIDKNIHIRVQNLSDFHIEKLDNDHIYLNCFDGGCWIINVSREHFGEINTDSYSYYLDNNNIFNDEIKREYD